jgi:hypothetical protein
MKFKDKEEIKELVRAFEACTLPKEEWTHEAHLTVGLYYLVHHPFGVAKNLMSDGICWLNDKHGTPNTDTSGYHETMTHFWLTAISEFLNSNAEESNISALTNGMLLELNDRNLPLKKYSRELLFSPLARREYVPPDLEGFQSSGFDSRLILQQS